MSTEQVTEEVPVELHTLDPEGVQEKLGEAMRQVVDAAVLCVRSAPYGIIPDPAHMGALRHAVKKLDIASAEANVTAALLKLAEQAEAAAAEIESHGHTLSSGIAESVDEKPADDTPQDIQTEGL